MNKSSKTTSLEIAKSVIEDEAQALLKLRETLGESFTQAVHQIAEMKPIGRVVVSGMGKAGLIGQKISATLASIGIPSFFLHPAEAVHGDLGRCTHEDVTLLLSNSGETSELLEMLPFIRRVGSPIISFTSSKTSSLGRSSDTTVEIGAHKEAGALGLAPTTSTTVMLALGDALAMALEKEKGISKEDFANFHPAGNLGRSLLVCREIMRTGDELCITDEDTLCKEVLNQISNTKGRPGAAIIARSDGSLAGIFTDGDLRRCLAASSDFLNEPIHLYMSKNPKTIAENTLVKEATQLMNELKIDQVIVVDKEQKAIGLLDIQDAVSVRMR